MFRGRTSKHSNVKVFDTLTFPFAFFIVKVFDTLTFSLVLLRKKGDLYGLGKKNLGYCSSRLLILFNSQKSLYGINLFCFLFSLL